MKLEVLVIPVSDVDRAKDFYLKLGFRLDIDYVGADNFRVVQLTPLGSEASIILGAGLSSSVPGSVSGIHLVVYDIVVVRDDLLRRGIHVSNVFHDSGGVFHHAGDSHKVDGPQAERDDYASFATFQDPDGNGWVLQEVKTRAPGR